MVPILLLVITSAELGWAEPALSSDAADKIERGKELTFARGKGNCLACHVVAGGEMAGNVAPPLIMMKVRYPDRMKLRAQIWDASALISTTTMPPFGRHRILTEEEIDLVVDFVLTL
ncbi:MAG: sulfur oxidation c-type cytochrome SoxX [Gammaproteobacteria bacterium]|nr:sulfur oxidation c-type cytochrome SoxX [Gammaproteobacteria bacterium]